MDGLKGKTLINMDDLGVPQQVTHNFPMQSISAADLGQSLKASCTLEIGRDCHVFSALIGG